MPKALREAITETLWENVKSYDLAEVRVPGLDPQREGEDPHYSKRAYKSATT
ncbi:hypothetical protein ACFY4C_40410 [Actinomadura viridis]|uniref:hypothetical protein n=1 Tax=Actinomadura viridis TaxID=58110 RepID=UPI0036C6BB7F